MGRTLSDIARDTVTDHALLPAGEPVLAMVSGGADSTALLRLLASGELGGGALSVLHVDHMLRGAESAADADSVSATCADLGVPCRVVRYDVGAYAAESGLNLEDAGRRVRYRFAEEELDARCAAAGLQPGRGVIATAHTHDDRMETFLMRLAAGSGPGGLSGIPYRRGRIVRPLLDARRSDVVAYLRALGQPWREDATNADTTRTRARVRAELLPLFEDMNPRFDEALFRTLDVVAEEERYLDATARAALEGLADTRPGEVRLDAAGLAALDRAIARRVLRAALVDAFPEASRIEFPHVEAVLDGLGDTGFDRDLTGGLRAFREYATLVVLRGRDEAGPLAPSLLLIPDMLDLGVAGRIVAERVEATVADEGTSIAVIDEAAIEGPLVVDGPRPGDRMRPLGMSGSRKLQDVLTDAKVPRRMRPITPVVRDGERVVWVAGVRLSDEFRVTGSTGRAVRLSYTGPTAGREDS